jgi:3-phosphoshikimate 1-carboxyvinyltransferase
MLLTDLDEDVVHLKRRTRDLEFLAPTLPTSWDLSNKLLIINALTDFRSRLYGLAPAAYDLRDLLSLPTPTFVSGGSVSVYAFLTADFSITQQETRLYYSHQDSLPIAPLVTALQSLGAKIEYIEQEGYPPLRLSGFEPTENPTISFSGLGDTHLLTALLLLAPILPFGLRIEIVPPLVNRSEIDATLSLMAHFGILHSWYENRIYIPHQRYRTTDYRLQADWQMAAVWYAFLALADEGSLFLANLHPQAHQAATAIMGLMKNVGVETKIEKKGIFLQKSKSLRLPHTLDIDLSDAPAQALFLATVLIVKGINARLSGLYALNQSQIHAALQCFEAVGAKMQLVGSTWVIEAAQLHKPYQLLYTYQNASLVLLLPALSLLFDVSIEKPSLAESCYPNYWQDLQRTGWNIERLL